MQQPQDPAEKTLPYSGGADPTPWHPAALSIPDYELLTRIGEGSYGEVWLARSVIGTFCAIKFIFRRRFPSERPYLQEFNGIRRYEPVSRTHPGLVQVLHVGRGANDDFFYYVMEAADDCVHGRQIDPANYTPKTLYGELRRQGRMPADLCASLGAGIAEALQYMHSKSLLHRDIKPSNIIFVDNRPKLADIGTVTEAAEAKTFVGTEGYVPPEGPGTDSADIYALGKVLYEISTGKDRLAFPEMPTGLTLNGDASRFGELNKAVLKACAPRMGERYDSAGTLHRDLLAIMQGRAIRSGSGSWRRRVALAAVAAVALAAVAWMTRCRITITPAFRFVSAATPVQTATATVRRAAATLPWPEDAPRDLALSADGQLLAVVADYKAQLYQAQDGALLSSFSIEKNPFTAAAFSPGGLLVLGRTNGDIELRDAADGTVRSTLRGHTGIINDLQFSPAGELLGSTSYDATARIWDVPRAEQVCELGGASGWVSRVAISPDGSLAATAHEDGCLRLWSLQPDDRARPLLTATERRAAGDVALAFSPDGARLAVGNNNGDARLWNVTRREIETRLGKRAARVAGVAFTPDGDSVWVASDSGALELFRVADGQPLVSLAAGNSWSSAFSQGAGYGAFYNSNGFIRVLDLQGRPLPFTRVQAFGNRTASLVVVPGALEIWAGAPQGSLVRWPSGDADHLARGQAEVLAPWRTALSPDGKWMACGATDHRVWLWRTDHAERKQLSAPWTDRPLAVAFSPDGKQLAAGGKFQGAILVWDLQHPDAPVTLGRHDNAVNDLAWSADGQLLASCDNQGAIRLWQAATRTETGALWGHRGWISSLTFVGPGRLLASGGYDGTVCVWDTEAHAVRQVLRECEGPVRDLAATCDGQYLAAVSEKGNLVVWNTATWRAEANVTGLGNELFSVAIAPDTSFLAAGTGAGEILRVAWKDLVDGPPGRAASAGEKPEAK